MLVILLKRSKGKEDSHGTARWAKLNEWKKAGLLNDYPKYRWSYFRKNRRI